jgi:hypothetical protein
LPHHSAGAAAGVVGGHLRVRGSPPPCARPGGG